MVLERCKTFFYVVGGRRLAGPPTTFPRKRCRWVRQRQPADNPPTPRNSLLGTLGHVLCIRPSTKFVLNCLNFNLLPPIFDTKCLIFLEMDKLIKVQA